MEAGFSFKLFKHDVDEATLIVSLETSNRVQEYFVEVFGFRRMKIIIVEIRDGTRKYFYKKNMLIVSDLSSSCLSEVIRELEETGDFFEIMKPLNSYARIRIYWRAFWKNLFHKNDKS